MCAPMRYTTRHRSVKRIFSFSSGTLNRLGSRGAVMGGSARDGAARLLDLRAGRGRHRHALHAELALYVPHAEQLDGVVRPAHQPGAEQRLRRDLGALGKQAAQVVNGFVNPRFGMRRMRGIWPPSNPGRTLPPWRAVCPLPPRPAVLPIPEPGPRPLRMRARCDPGGLRRLDSVMCRSSGFAAFARGFAFGLALVFALAFAFGFAIAYSPAFAFAGVTSTRWRT